MFNKGSLKHNKHNGKDQSEVHTTELLEKISGEWQLSKKLVTQSTNCSHYFVMMVRWWSKQTRQALHLWISRYSYFIATLIYLYIYLTKKKGMTTNGEMYEDMKYVLAHTGTFNLSYYFSADNGMLFELIKSLLKYGDFCVSGWIRNC